MVTVGPNVDVAIIGGGPCGLTLAALLGRYGHDVVVLERHPARYPLPRASLSDHEVMRILQSLGIAEAYVKASAEPATTYHWVNGDGDRLMSIDWRYPDVSGWGTAHIGFQPVLEDLLVEAITATGCVQTWRGWEVDQVALGRPARLRAVEYRSGPRDGRAATGAVRELQARFVVGADGSNGFLRTHLGIGRQDLGFDSEWLVVDGEMKDGFPSRVQFGAGEIRYGPELFQICDPRRPSFVGPLGRGRRRFEWAVLPEEDSRTLATEAAAWDLLAPLGVSQDNLDLYRHVIYRFEAYLADRWQQGNAFLIGDAAHSMPPYLGQGMGSGLRDAKNLAWKLDLVLTGRCPERLLDTYESERKPNARHWIDASVAVGQVSCTFDPHEASARDERFRLGEGPTGAPPERLEVGLLQPDDSTAGRLSVQGRVRQGDIVALLDDLVPTGRFQVLALDAEVRLDAESRRLVQLLGIELVTVGPQGAFQDVDATYERYARELAASYVVIRPDFYVFGAAVDTIGLNGLLHALGRQLQ